VSSDRVAVVGAGIGGLVAAVELARRGLDVVVFEGAAGPGGKMLPVEIDGRVLDAGPTVLTMRWVFERVFADAGASLDDALAMRPLDILARHAWPDGSRLDLFADVEASAEAIRALAGPQEAEGYRAFCRRARDIYATLERSFIEAEQPTPVSLAFGAGLSGLGDLWRISPFTTLWRALGEHFRDPRLRQLFGRYATYCGSSPFLAPATLMLVAHVEQVGVWSVDGGMHRLAAAVADLASRHGARFRYGCHVGALRVSGGAINGVVVEGEEPIDVEAVVFNGDAAALGAGLLGDPARHATRRIEAGSRSLSAVTWALVAETEGFPLVRHNVLFSGDYAAEFDDIFRRQRLPSAPTVYVCAEDRGESAAAGRTDPERLLCLVNAPASGDLRPLAPEEIARCEDSTFATLERVGLKIRRRAEASIRSTPVDFERRYPATGGALYGQASHGWKASFSRPPAHTSIKGLYLAGGSVHPGAGVPMAALSGRLAAQRLMADLTSRPRSRATAMRGGTSTR
jgi:1-hydroxycarotenoid 3,4-desaturase